MIFNPLRFGLHNYFQISCGDVAASSDQGSPTKGQWFSWSWSDGHVEI